MNEKTNILDDSSDSEVELKVNQEYANRYNVWRNKEELQKYKDLKKEDDESESSSESEEEVPEFDEEFFRALSLLKGKDPRIYDKNYELFTNKEEKKKKTVKEKPMFMKDYERNIVLEKGGEFSDEDEPNLSKVKTYDQDLDNLKKSFKRALDESDNDDDDLLQVRTKSINEEKKEEADYLQWLKGEEKEVSEDVKKDMSYLRNYWNDPKLEEGEKYLRDYILNKRYLEKDDSEVPTYDELTSGMLSDDEKIIEEQEKFEHKYNFRFEEPDEEFIKRYPRTVGDSLRKVDNRRKQMREDKAQRKRKEREQRKEELKRLKALKRKEIEEKFLKIKEISGQDEINLDESDMESDFDPDKHDQKMRELFNDDYYNVEEYQKPEFPFDEELDAENWNNWTGEKIVSDEDANHDLTCMEINNFETIQLNPKDEFENKMIEATQAKPKIRKKSLFAKVISQPKPIYDPGGKSYDEYLEEYFKLDYEDVIGDLPVRYKYRKVIPNDFGLTINEILAADDKELNRWCSVKKTCQYRNDEEEVYDVQAYKKKSQNIMAKKKILSSMYTPPNFKTDASNDEIDDKVVNDNGETLNHEAEKLTSSVIDSGCKHNKMVSNKRKKEKGANDHDLHMDDVNQGCFSNFPESDENQDVFEHPNESKQMHVDNLDSSTCHANNPSVFDATLNVDSSPKIVLKAQKKRKKPFHLTEESMVSSIVKGEESLLKVSKQKESQNHTILHKSTDNFSSFASESEEPGSNQLTGSLSYDSVPDNTFQDSVQKKRKKKKKNKNKNSAKNPTNCMQFSQSKSHQLKNTKMKEHSSNDKRLGLSDERLAAYGINPKKFKNKIVHAKK